MRILRWMSRHTKKDKFWNGYIQEKVRVVPIEENMIKIRLRWFGHMQRRSPKAPVKKI